jgi:hypothetical protein
MSLCRNNAQAEEQRQIKTNIVLKSISSEIVNLGFIISNIISNFAYSSKLNKNGNSQYRPNMVLSEGVYKTTKG